MENRRSVVTGEHDGVAHRAIIEEHEVDGKLVGVVIELTADPVGNFTENGERWLGFGPRWRSALGSVTGDLPTEPPMAWPLERSWEDTVRHYQDLANNPDGKGWWG